jgi:hypothetical protein
MGCGTNRASDGFDDGGTGSSADATAAGADDTSSADANGMFAGGDSAPIGNGCASADAKPALVPATVWIVADLSGAETFTLSSATLGQLRHILLGTGGLIPSLQAVEAFGFVGVDDYTGTGCPATDLDCGTLPAGDPFVGCPGLHIVAPALMNAAAIANAFPTAANDPNARTYDGVAYVVNQLPSAAEIAQGKRI